MTVTLARRTVASAILGRRPSRAAKFWGPFLERLFGGLHDRYIGAAPLFFYFGTPRPSRAAKFWGLNLGAFLIERLFGGLSP